MGLSGIALGMSCGAFAEATALGVLLWRRTPGTGLEIGHPAVLRLRHRRARWPRSWRVHRGAPDRSDRRPRARAASCCSSRSPSRAAPRRSSTPRYTRLLRIPELQQTIDIARSFVRRGSGGDPWPVGEAAEHAAARRPRSRARGTRHAAHGAGPAGLVPVAAVASAASAFDSRAVARRRPLRRRYRAPASDGHDFAPRPWPPAPSRSSPNVPSPASTCPRSWSRRRAPRWRSRPRGSTASRAASWASSASPARTARRPPRTSCAACSSECGVAGGPADDDRGDHGRRPEPGLHRPHDARGAGDPGRPAARCSMRATDSRSSRRHRTASPSSASPRSPTTSRSSPT